MEKLDLVRNSHTFPIKKEHAYPKIKPLKYDEIEKNEPINIQIDSQRTENEKTVRKEQIKEEDIDMMENPYQKAITNINIKDESKVDQMNNWSIFSDKLRYVDSSINETHQDYP